MPIVYAYREDLTDVKEGDELIDFRGEKWKFLSVTSRGKIWAAPTDGSGFNRELNPQVFNLHVGVKDAE